MFQVFDEHRQGISFASLATTLLAGVAALAIFAASPAHANSDEELQDYAASVSDETYADDETVDEAARFSDEDDLDDVRRPSFRPTFRPPVFRPVATYRPPVFRPTFRPTYRPVSRPTYRPVSRPAFRPVARPISRPIYRPVTRPISRPVHRPVSRPTSRPSRPVNAHRPRPHHVSRPTGTVQRPQHGAAHRPIAGRPVAQAGRPGLQPAAMKPQTVPAQAIHERPHKPGPGNAEGPPNSANAPCNRDTRDELSDLWEQLPADGTYDAEWEGMMQAAGLAYLGGPFALSALVLGGAGVVAAAPEVATAVAAARPIVSTAAANAATHAQTAYYSASNYCLANPGLCTSAGSGFFQGYVNGLSDESAPDFGSTLPQEPVTDLSDLWSIPFQYAGHYAGTATNLLRPRPTTLPGITPVKPPQTAPQQVSPPPGQGAGFLEPCRRDLTDLTLLDMDGAAGHDGDDMKVDADETDMDDAEESANDGE